MGLLIAGRFELQEKVGEGTFAEIWKAVDGDSGRLVAVKVFRPSAAGDARRPWQVVLNEAGAGTRMRAHHNVVSPWAFVRARRFGSEETPCLVMDYVEGPNLAGWLERQPPPGPAAIADRLTVMRSLLAGLSYAHESRVIHRDLSFGNILVPASPPLRARLGDFGCAQVEEPLAEEMIPVEEPAALQPINPPPYSALLPLRDGMRRDVYAFATLSYLVLAGRHPLSDAWQTMRHGAWQGAADPHAALDRRPLVELAPWMAHDARLVRLSDVLVRCVAVDPEERPASAVALAGAWDDALA